MSNNITFKPGTQISPSDYQSLIHPPVSGNARPAVDQFISAASPAAPSTQIKRPNSLWTPNRPQ